MRRLPLVAGLLLLGASACSSPTSTFGVQYRVTKPTGAAAAGCALAGNASGGGEEPVDLKQSYPHLFLRTHQDGGDSPYTFEVYIAKSSWGTTPWDHAEERETLKQTAYDRAFGEASNSDTFTVEFEGQTYRFEVEGIPRGGACPR